MQSVHFLILLHISFLFAALSTFFGKNSELHKYLKGLVRYAGKYYNSISAIMISISTARCVAERCVPSEDRGRARLSLLATAGLRKMRPEEQDWILAKARAFLQSTEFFIDLVKVLTGEEEALYDWLAVVSAYRGDGSQFFNGESPQGVIDMGGESKQIAYSISHTAISSSDGRGSFLGKSAAYRKSHCAPRWLIQLPNVPEQIPLFSRSYNGFGLIASMNIVSKAYHDKVHAVAAVQNRCNHAARLLDGHSTLDVGVGVDSTLTAVTDENCFSDGFDPEAVGVDMNHPRYHHPCYAPGVFPPGDSHDLDYDLNGSGNFSACLDFIREIFTPNIPEIDLLCMKVT